MSSEVTRQNSSGGKTVWVPAENTLRSVDDAANRLRSWALIRGAEIEGPPFVRVQSMDELQVHLPVRGRIELNSETGLTFGERLSGEIDVLPGIAFQDLEASVEAAQSHDLPSRGRAAFEFHPSGRDMRSGDLVWPAESAPQGDQRGNEPAGLAAQR